MRDDADALVAKIRDVVRAHVGPDVELDDDTSLVSGGLVDSMSLVDLILDLERALGRRLARDAIGVDDFESIRAIVLAIQRPMMATRRAPTAPD